MATVYNGSKYALSIACPKHGLNIIIEPDTQKDGLPDEAIKEWEERDGSVIEGVNVRYGGKKRKEQGAA